MATTYGLYFVLGPPKYRKILANHMNQVAKNLQHLSWCMHDNQFLRASSEVH